MFAILLCTIIGFLAGLSYVMVKRKIRPGAIIAVTFLGLLSVAAWKTFKDYSKSSGKWRKS